MDKDLSVMLDHAKGCEKRPENELMRRLDEAEAEAGELRAVVEAARRGSCDMSDGCPPNHGGLYPDAKFCEGCTLGPLLAGVERRCDTCRRQERGAMDPDSCGVLQGFIPRKDFGCNQWQKRGTP